MQMGHPCTDKISPTHGPAAPGKQPQPWIPFPFAPGLNPRLRALNDSAVLPFNRKFTSANIGLVPIRYAGRKYSFYT